MLLYVVSTRVADGVPVVQHAMRPAEEARAEAGVGAAVENRLEQHRPVAGIVFEIGVLHDHDVAACSSTAPAESPRPCRGSPADETACRCFPCASSVSRICCVPSVE